MREAHRLNLFFLLLTIAVLPEQSTAQSSGLAEPSTDLSPAEAEAIARDVADAAISQISPPLLSKSASTDRELTDLSVALTGLADALDSGQSKDEVRKAYDRVIFALANLGRGTATPSAGEVSAEAPPLLTDLQELGRYVAKLQASP